MTEPSRGPAGAALVPPPLRSRDAAAGAPGRSRADADLLPLPLLVRGKVREVYELPGDRLLLVASDRVSAFDVVLDRPVPGKGRALTMLTAWWLAGRLGDAPHHLLSVRPDEIEAAAPALAACRDRWEGRASLVRKTRPAPVECVVRGWLAGSAWKEYREAGTLAGEPLPPGLDECAALSPPIFSPATKAREGHDENISFARAARLLGDETARRLRERSLDLYERGRAAAAEAGLILADTKFEFGFAADGRLLLIDEALTPDSSRYWPAEQYAPGQPQPSLDKQPVREWLSAQPGWERRPTTPSLPAEVAEATAERYRELFRRLVGVALDDYEPPAFDEAETGA